MTLNCFRIVKSDMDEEAVREVKLPDKDVPAIIKLMADLKLIDLSLKIFWFLQYQIV